MRKNWSVTYERWTEDDYEAGDTNDRGFVLENASFREALEEVGGQYAYYEPNCWPADGRESWITNTKYNQGSREAIEQGIDEERSLHIPDHITMASRRRLGRILGYIR